MPALELGLPVWSQDKDPGVAGAQVFTTGDLLDALRDDEQPGRSADELD